MNPGKMIRSTELWLISRSCQKRCFPARRPNFLEVTRARPVKPFPGNRVPFVGHGARTFLALGKVFFGFQHLGSLQVPKFCGPAFDARAHKGENADKFGVQIALNHLCCDGGWSQTELLANKCLHLRREMGACANGARKFADRDPSRAAFILSIARRNSSYISANFKTECGGLGVDPMASANFGCVFVSAGFSGDGFARAREICQQEIGGLDHLHCKRGIDDVAAGESKMEPATRRIVDVLSHIRGERDNIMVQRLLEFLQGSSRLKAARDLIWSKSLFGTTCFLDKRLGREQFDLEPNLQLPLVRPNFAHRRARITLNHAQSNKA